MFTTTNKNRAAYVGVAVVIIAGLYGTYSYIQTVPTVTSVNGMLAKLDKNQLLGASDAVVIGTIISTESFKAPSDIFPNQDSVYTNVIIKVQQYPYNPKGYTYKQITVRTLGGQIGNEKTEVTEGHVYREGQTALMFVRQVNDSEFKDVAPQGTYTVNSDGSLGADEREHVFIRDAFGRDMNVENVKSELDLAIPVRLVGSNPGK